MTVSLTSLPLPNHMRQSDMESDTDRASVHHCYYEKCATGLKTKQKKTASAVIFKVFYVSGSLIPHAMCDVLDTLEIKHILHNCTYFACTCFFYAYPYEMVLSYTFMDRGTYSS